MKSEELSRYACMYREMRERLATPYLTFDHAGQAARCSDGEVEGKVDGRVGRATLRAPFSEDGYL